MMFKHIQNDSQIFRKCSPNIYEMINFHHQNRIWQTVVECVHSTHGTHRQIRNDFKTQNKYKTYEHHNFNFLVFPSFSFLQSLFSIPWWRPSGHILQISFISFQSVMATAFKSQRASKTNTIWLRPWSDHFGQAWPPNSNLSHSRHWSLHRPLQTDDEEEEVPCSLSLSVNVDDDSPRYQT